VTLFNVALNSDSFISIVASAIEVFDLEVGGLLFGDRLDDSIFVTQAIPLQTAERSRDGVHFRPVPTTRVLRIWDDLTVHWPLGDFHSHPEEGDFRHPPDPSEPDEQMHPGDLSIIIALWETRRRRRLAYDPEENWIQGSVGKYHIHLAAWYCREPGDLERTTLWCPYIHVINLGHATKLTRRPGLLFSPDTYTQHKLIRKLRTLIKRYEQQIFNSFNLDKGKSTLRDIERLLRRIQQENE
jgi:proteasome lid subunit RPN8/RPN11